MERRQKDDGYEKRRAFDYKTMLVIMTALVGSGGVTGLISAFTDPNVKLGMRVDTIESAVTQNTTRAIRNYDTIEAYIKTHEKEETLKDQIVSGEFEHLKDLLNEIKNDQEEIKQDLRAIRNGRK